MKLPIVIAVGVILTMSLESCTRRLTDFTVISTKNIPIGEGVHTDFQKGSKRVKGEDVSHIVLFFPMGYPNMKDAIDKAIEQIPGAIGLVDGVVKTGGWSCLLYGQNKYIVEGTPLFPSDFDYEEENYGRPKSYAKKPASNSGKAVKYVEPTTEEPTQTFIFYHDVKDGETLPSIAKAYNVSVSDLIKWNKLSESTLRKGQKITIYLNN